MSRPKILFRGSFPAPEPAKTESDPQDPSTVQYATRVASELGSSIIREGFDLILTGSNVLESAVGEAALNVCRMMAVEPRERIRTYLRPRAKSSPSKGFGMILRPLHLPRRHFHAEIVKESSAIVGLMGRSGTAECLLNGRLSNKLIFPIATVPGSARDEWEQAKRDLHKNREPGDLDFLADSGADPQTLVGTILDQCRRALHGETPPRPRKVFIAHGHSGLQNELARALTKLKFSPLILAEQPGVGRTVREMLLDAVKDVGFALVLYTPDDLGSLATERRWRPRARQNVVFEHGLLIGILGPTRVCAILLENGTDKRGFDIPSDILGERTLLLRHGSTVVETGMKIGPELRHAGYTVDLSLLTEP